MPYPRQLGIAPLIIAEIPTILNDIKGLFTGSSYDATHQQILTWAQQILADPGLAQSATQSAWLRLRCWAGDQTVINASDEAYLFGGGNPAQGCGCEVDHGCRADAQATVAHLEQVIPQLKTGALSTNAYTNPDGSAAQQPASGSGTSIPVNVGPFTVGVPVTTGQLAGATIGGIPVMALLVLGGVAVFALGQKGRH